MVVEENHLVGRSHSRCADLDGLYWYELVLDGQRPGFEVFQYNYYYDSLSWI